ncbi:MAG: histidine kinase [Candidatus Promineifilaceae bacterium]|nr:histidine kinase [Candidatus Promineifilaceae bacterium]
MLRWRGLPIQLFVFTILPLTLLLLVFAFGSLFLHQRSMRQMVGERDERATRAAASAISEQVKHRAAALRSLALRAADLGAPEHVLEDAVYLLPDFDGGIALYTGAELLATSNERTTWETELIPQQLIEDPPLPGAAAFRGPFTDSISGMEMMLVMATTPKGLTAAGAFSPAGLAEGALEDIFANDDRATAVLTDEQGQLLFHIGGSYEAGADLRADTGVTAALRGGSGTIYVSGERGEEVIAFSSIPPLNWTLVIKEPWQEVADPLLRATEWAPLVLAPVLVVALMGLIFGLRQIVQPLQSLEKKAADLGWGNYEAIEEPVGGINEIRRLQAELIHMARKVKLAQQSLRGYLGAVTTGQEEERRRLARELHDDTIQSLIALNQRIQLAQLAAGDGPSAAQLTEMQQMTAQTIADLRRLTRDLRPIYLEDLGLATALNMLVQETGDALRIPVEFQVTGRERRLAPEVELALYRIGQEALSNVARHAQASRAQLDLAYAADQITLSIVDNGAGFDQPDSPAEMAGNGHFGLLGIQERAEIIGAHLKIESQPGRGTRLTITLASIQ